MLATCVTREMTSPQFDSRRAGHFLAGAAFPAMKYLLLACLLLGSACAEEADAGLRFLENRVASDPDDMVAQNQLIERYLTKLRTEGRLVRLVQARKAAEASLRSIPLDQNLGAHLGSARVALAEHRFADAAKLAESFCAVRPKSPGGYETLFDAQVELGAYEQAAKTLDQLEQIGGNEVSLQSRRALLARLHGQDAKPFLAAASAEAQKTKDSALRTWCLVQQGADAFSRGDFDAAEKCYAEALTLSPSDWRARVRKAEWLAATGKLDEACALLEEITASTERAELMQALGDLESLRKNESAAKDWHTRAEALYLASVQRGEILYVHHLAGFYCDSIPKPAEAVKLARQDLAARPNIYTHAALAWALHLDGQLEAAAAEADLALATGVKDAHLLYQAGLIYTAAGNFQRGRELMRASEIANPRRTAFHLHP